MQKSTRPCADAHEQVAPDAELPPIVRRILERMARVAYVIDCHRQAIVKHSRHLAELEAELERIEVRP